MNTLRLCHHRPGIHFAILLVLYSTSRDFQQKESWWLSDGIHPLRVQGGIDQGLRYLIQLKKTGILPRPSTSCVRTATPKKTLLFESSCAFSASSASLNVIWADLVGPVPLTTKEVILPCFLYSWNNPSRKLVSEDRSGSCVIRSPRSPSDLRLPWESR